MKYRVERSATLRAVETPFDCLFGKLSVRSVRIT